MDSRVEHVEVGQHPIDGVINTFDISMIESFGLIFVYYDTSWI